MAHNDDEDIDLLRVLQAKEDECESLREELCQVVSEWMYAEIHHLLMADIGWLRQNKITVLDTPDGQWELWCKGKKLVTADTVREGITLVRLFEGDK